MTWNWNHKNWPGFTYSSSELAGYEREFLHKAGMLLGSLRHIDRDGQSAFSIQILSDEAYKTSEIEGEILNRDSLQSSIRRQFGLSSDNRKIPLAERGISEMMVDLYKSYDDPLSHNQLFNWHSMLTLGRRDLMDMGAYRTHEDPMQIVSGPTHRPQVHFEAPPSVNVSTEMEGFIKWFNDTVGSLSPLIRAGIAHLYFESIHPFEDGNGRIGRAISEKALSQGIGRPTLIALSYTIEKYKKEYYKALQDHSRDLEITGWLVYFSEMILLAQDTTQETIDFLIEKGKFYIRFEQQLNDRQLKVVSRIFREGIEGFRGGLSAQNYMTITGATASTATRDLQRMVEMGALKRTGERKGTRYFLMI